MFIGVACTIPDLPNLPGQGGESITVTLDYPSSDVCYDATTSPSDASPAGGVFSYTGSGTLDLNTSNGAIDANDSDPGSYTVIYTKSGVSSNFPITIGNDITLSITPVPGATICTGDTATLTANASGGTGTISYLWSTSATSQAISVTTSGTYTVEVTDGNGCTATASQAIIVSTAATTIASINNDAAMSFNGTDQYVDAGDFSLNASEGTVSAWIKSTNTSAFQMIIGKTTGGAGNDQLQFRTESTTGKVRVTLFYSGGYTILDSTATVLDGNWHHVAFTYSSSGMNIYIDGSASGSNTTNVTPLSTSTESFMIGARKISAPNSFFNGEIDEVAVFDSKLSSCDIKGIYEGSIGSNAGKAANLLDANTTIPAPVYWNRMGDS
jgi:hypothetical protein